LKFNKDPVGINTEEIIELLHQFVNNCIFDLHKKTVISEEYIQKTLLSIFKGQIVISHKPNMWGQNNFNIFNHTKNNNNNNTVNQFERRQFERRQNNKNFMEFDDSPDNSFDDNMFGNNKYPVLLNNNIVRNNNIFGNNNIIQNNNIVRNNNIVHEEKLDITDDNKCIQYARIETTILPPHIIGEHQLVRVLEKSIILIKYLLTKPNYLTNEGVNILSDVINEKDNICDVYRRIYFEILSQTNIELFNNDSENPELVNITSTYFDNLFSLLTM
jgi:hypothetical protein